MYKNYMLQQWKKGGMGDTLTECISLLWSHGLPLFSLGAHHDSQCRPDRGSQRQSDDDADSGE